MEILVVPLCLMAVLSVVAVLAAFFSRRAARVCAGAAVGIVVLFLLAVLLENRWNFGWLLFLFLEASPPFVVIYGALLLSAVAAWAPLRHPGTICSDGAPLPGRPRWRLLALAGSVTVIGVGYGIAQVIGGNRGEEKTRALLAGDPNVRLKRVQIDHQQRRLICTDPEVLRYLEEQFRRHEPHPNYLGTSYELTLTYADGGAQAFSSYWADTGDFNLALGELGEGGKGHGIRLHHPRPRGVEELVSFVLKSNREAAGTVLILDAGGSRVERDESLVAR